MLLLSLSWVDSAEDLFIYLFSLFWFRLGNFGAIIASSFIACLPALIHLNDISIQLYHFTPGTATTRLLCSALPLASYDLFIIN